MAVLLYLKILSWYVSTAAIKN